MPFIGLTVILLGIFILFRLDKDQGRVPGTIWIPFTWFVIASSRPISSWLTFSVPDSTNDHYIDGTPLDRNSLTFLLLLTGLVLIQKSPQVWAIIRKNPAFICYFIYCLISLTWADYPFVVFKRWIRSVGDLAMILAIVTGRNRDDALKQVLTRIGYVLIPLSILFIRFFPALGRAYSIGGEPMWTGVATDKNALGATSMLVGIVAVSRLIWVYRDVEQPFRKQRLWALAALLAMVVYLLQTADSQTARMCFIMGITLVIVTSKPAF